MRLLLVNLSECPENFHLEQAFIRSCNATRKDTLDIVHHFVNSDYRFLEPVKNRTGFRIGCVKANDIASLLPRDGYDWVLHLDYPVKKEAFIQFMRLSLARKGRRTGMVFNHLLPTPEQSRCVAHMARGRLLRDMERIYMFEFERPEHCAALGARPERVALRPYALDCVYYAPRPAKEGGYIFSCGSAQRDYDLLVDAVRGMRPPLKIFTDTPTDRLRAAGAAGQVQLGGFCENLAGLRQAIAESSFIVVPAKPLFGHSNETVGLAVAYMGMAMEKAVIVRDTPYLRRIITDGEDGLLYQAGDRQDLCRKIECLMADDDLRQAMGKKGRQTVLAKGNLDGFVEQLMSDLLSLSGAPS